MRYSPEIEAMILAQIVRTPDKEIILPDWAYWEGDPQPWVYIDRMPTRLMRHLYQLVVGELHPNHGLVNPPGVDPRNINPRLAVLTPARRAKLQCPRGHLYTGDDYIEGVGHRCQTCRAEKQLGKKPTQGDLNRAKTHCPLGHEYTRRGNGKRRCPTCHREAERDRRQKIKESQHADHTD